jgi:uncharacterized protein YkwD
MNRLRIPWLIGMAGWIALSGPALAGTGLRGDADQSGKINISDATLVLRASVGLVKLTEAQKLLADANNDGRVNAADATVILRRAVGLVSDLGNVDLPSKVKVYVKNNETVLAWPKTGKSVVGLEFTQGATVYKTAEAIEPIDADNEGFVIVKDLNHSVDDQLYGNGYTDFKDFKAGQPVTADVFVADSTAGPFTDVDSVTFNPVPHVFSPGLSSVLSSEIALDNDLSDTASVGDSIVVSGKVASRFSDGSPANGLRADGYIIPPSGIPVKIPMVSATPFDPGSGFGLRINPGGDFKLQFKIDTPGSYVVEVNDYGGEATLNRTIYVGDGIPLIPGAVDYFKKANSGPAVDLAQAAKDWLDLVNQDRATYGLNPVTLDASLTAAAAEHADDMAKNNYRGHIGLDGSDPTTRAIRAGVALGTNVTENVVEAGRVVGLEANLMASAIHRSAILNPEWKRAGLGIALNPDTGFLVGAQEFGASPGEYSIPTDFFTGVQLDSALPSAFTPGKTVTISGKTMNGAQTALVFLQNAVTGQQLHFPDAPVALGADGRFSIDISFDASQAGLYLMTLSLDGKGNTANYIMVDPLALP